MLPRRSTRAVLCAGLGLVLLAGCATSRPVDKALLAESTTARGAQHVADGYHLRCPDLLDVSVDLRPDVPPGRRPVGPDGCIDVGPLGRVRVEGQTPAQAAERVANLAGVPRAAVQVHVVEHKSQQVYIFGQVNGLQRAVPYQGPETVRDLLQRVGGITAGAEPTSVYVVRSNIADGKRPEIFPVDLQAIVMKKDDKTNIRLEPFDQIFIGESRQASYVKCVPPILRPLYETLVGIERTPGIHSTSRGEPVLPAPPPPPALPGSLARQ